MSNEQDGKVFYGEKVKSMYAGTLLRVLGYTGPVSLTDPHGSTRVNFVSSVKVEWETDVD